MRGKSPKLTHSLLSELFESTPRRSQQKQVEIVEGAIRALIRHGFDKTTHGKVADESGVSRSLVIHYFPTIDALFTFTVKYIRAIFQEDAIKEIKTSQSSREMLEKYTKATFTWTRKREAHAKVWLHFYFLCSINKKYKTLHTQMVTMGHKRIMEILAGGNKAGEFKCDQLSQTAKMIQVIITGALVTLGTEEVPFPLSELESATVNECLRIAGAS